MNDYIDRLIQEQLDVRTRLEKLDRFLQSDLSKDLPEIEVVDLRTQKNIMEGYCAILQRRLLRLQKE